MKFKIPIFFLLCEAKTQELVTAYLYILNVVLALLRLKEAAVTQPWGGQSVEPLASFTVRFNRRLQFFIGEL